MLYRISLLALFLVLALHKAHAQSPEALRLRCAGGLAHLTESWSVPGAGEAYTIAQYFDFDRDLVYLRSSEDPNKIFVLGREQTFIADFPRAKITANLTNRQRITFPDLPNQPTILHLTGIEGLWAKIKAIPPKDLPEDLSNWAKPVTTRPVTEAEAKIAHETFVKAFRQLWDLRKDFRDPSFLAKMTNLQSDVPNPQLVDELEANCAALFEP